MISKIVNDKVVKRDKENLKNKEIRSLLTEVESDLHDVSNQKAVNFFEMLSPILNRKELYRLILRYRRLRIYSSYNSNPEFETTMKVENNQKIIENIKFSNENPFIVYKDISDKYIFERRMYFLNESIREFDNKKFNLSDIAIDMFVDAIATQRFDEVEGGAIKLGFVSEKEKNKNRYLFNRACQEVVSEYLQLQNCKYNDFYTVNYIQHLNYFAKRKVSNVELDKAVYLIKYMLNLMNVDMLQFIKMFLLNETENFNKLKVDFVKKSRKQIDNLSINM